MSFEAVLKIQKDQEKIYRCLKPELSKRGRSSVTVKRKEGYLRINVTAEDAVAFRTALNSITQLLTVYKEMEEIK